MSDKTLPRHAESVFPGATGYRRRWIEPRLAELFTTFEVVVLTCARQVGKTTLLRNLDLPGRWAYVTMDDLDTRARRKCAAGIVVYRGSEVRRPGAKLAAVPWWVVAGA